MSPALLLGLIWSVTAVEPRVTALSDRLHSALVQEGRLFSDAEAARWCIELLGDDPPIQVNFLDDAEPRAFSLPDGRIYLSAGLFLPMRDPEQLLFVLAHERSHLIEDAPGHSADPDGYGIEIELRADADAVAVLRERGLAPGVAAAALQGLAERADELGLPADRERLEARLAAMPAPVPDPAQRAFDPAVGSLKARALRSLLDRGRWMLAARCLESDCALDLDPPDRQLLSGRQLRQAGQLMPALDRLSPLAGLPGVGSAADRALGLTLLQLGRPAPARQHWNRLLEEGAPDRDLIQRWLSAAAPGDLPGQPAESGIPHRFSGLSLRLPDDWFRLASDAGSLRFTRDGAAIQTFSVGLSDRPLESEPLLELDRWLREIRDRHGARRLTWQDAAPFRGADGLRVTLSYRDRLGLDWQLALYRFSVGDRTVEAIFQAPRLHYFDRDRPAVEAALAAVTD